MKPFNAAAQCLTNLPDWVPDAARNYLLHTGAGVPIRELARMQEVHASTISRQVARFETRRDDPLIDRGLYRLSLADQPGAAETLSARAALEAVALPVLRKLCEPGAVLAVGDGMDRAVVVREEDDHAPQRRAVVEVAMAEALALCGWIECRTPGRIARYRISQNGRQTLTRLMSRAEQKGMAEAQSDFRAAPRDPETPLRARFAAGDTPLQALSRRRGKDGAPFLSPELVRAGERLREDYEISRMGKGAGPGAEAGAESGAAKALDRLLAGALHAPPGEAVPGDASAAARARVARALHDLGPGLGDMVLRCCCRLEGLEEAEQRMGWSARSGKIVLRIALQRLRRHYDDLGDSPDTLIG